MSPRFNDLEQELGPAVEQSDTAALVAQRGRTEEFALILGCALAAVSAAVQQKENPFDEYLVEWAKAEELRSLYFRYLFGVEKMDIKVWLGVLAAALSASAKAVASWGDMVGFSLNARLILSPA
ncbi:MAG: hypothetical protein ACR2QO_17540 [Acidimicrobiales bacterium]